MESQGARSRQAPLAEVYLEMREDGRVGRRERGLKKKSGSALFFSQRFC
jgi:hypothetical protein